MKFGNALNTVLIVVAFSLAAPVLNAFEGQAVPKQDRAGLGDSYPIIEMLSMRIEKDPLDFYAYNKRGIVWFYKGNLAKAISDYTRAITANLKFSEAYANRGVAWYTKGNYAKAISDFTTAIQRDPRYFQAYAYRGDAWYKQKMPDKAVSDYNTALEIFPQYARAYNNRGFVWNMQGAYELALADYTRALEIDPNDWETCCNLSWLLSTCPDGRYRHGDRAITLAEKAVGIKSNRISLDCLAAAYAETANFGKAVTTQENAIRSIEEQKGTGSPSRYRQRLNSYVAGKPWRESFVIVPQKSIPVEVARPALPTPTVVLENNRDPVKTERVLRVQRSYPYTIQVSSYPQNEKSYAKALQLKLKGDAVFTSYARIAGKGDWYRIFVGYYPSYAEAQKAAEVLKQRKFRYTHVVKMPYAVQVGCYESTEALAATEAGLLSKKYVPYRVPGAKGMCGTRLLNGAFDSAGEAEVVAERLKKEGFDTLVVQR